ncbi:calcium channel protein, partial [Tulasnella sp. 403]
KLAGSIFVTASFKNTLKELLKSSVEFDDDEYTERAIEEFDRKTKCLFDDPEKFSFIKLGNKKQHEPSLNIRGGLLKLSGAKAVAHGAVAWYLDRLVTARVARQTYGTDCATLFDKSNAGHCSRSHLARISDASGLLFIGPLFRALVTKGEAIQTDSVFRRSFTVERRQKSDVLYVMTLDRYDGTIEDIDFYDKDKESFSTVCRMPIPIPAEAFEPCIGLKGMFWHVSVDVVLSLGETELECHAEWEVEGEKKRSRVFTEWIGDANSRTRSPRQLHHSYSSQASLDSNASVAHTDGDDEIHLTSAASGPGDPERSEQRTRRRVSRPPGHYGETSAPRRTLGTLKSVSRNLRRVSVRVVNLAGVTLEDRPIRLEDDTPDETRPGESTQEDAVPESRFRLAMLRVLLWKWTEPLILLLIFVDAIVLIIQAHRSVFITGREDGFFGRWEDYVLFVLFLIFSLEALARILVTGLLLDPETRITDTQTLIKGLMNAHSRVHSQFSGSTLTLDTEAIRQNMADGVPEKHSYPPSTPGSTTPVERKVNNTWVGSKVGLPTRTLPFQIAIEKQQSLSARNLPYLRHSWNRIDFIAVISFWVTFALAVSGAETQVNRHLYIFRALSVLRISRLLAVTSGTTTIMKSLKTAGPILVQVATFVLFAVLLFSIVGVQSFKGSFRRTCRLIDPSMEDRSAWLDLKQTCGGQIGPDSENTTAYFYLDGRQAPESKGYICPLGQLCQESPSNPHSDLQGFDNIFIGALQVLIIAGANQWSTSMYMMMDADFYVSCIFFIVCIVILNFWLINLFVAVITNTFSSIRAETKRSAFGASAAGPVIDEKGEEWSMISGKQHDTRSRLQDWYMRTRIGWVLLIAADLIVQGTRTSTSSQSHLQFLDVFELTATIAFDIEMVWRICSYFPDWRAFGSKKSNYLDLALCIITSIIQIPPIHDAGFYPWLTIFQLLRFYRVILAVPTMRPLLLRVFGNMGGLFNMTLFLLFTNLLGALIAVQLFRGDIRADDHMNFGQTYTAFLAMYQIFSSENWTDVLYLAADDSKKFKQTLIAVLFFAAWFLFANFILLQMFIAVINENFEVAEEQKQFLIKVIADGFIFTPNAYLLSIWNVIDFLILNALLVNMISTLIVAGGVSRLTRALKAFRTLRLITFFPWMRDTFHSVLFAGAQSLFEAALLALLYMIPYAIWGLNLFSGVMYTCNDGGVAGKASCVNEYFSVPIDDSDIGFLAPRSWDKPSPSTTFSFDSFGSSLLILFEVVSFEGWIDVMGVAMDVVGKDMQPQLNNAQLNSIFFLIYDLLGAVIILTLFVSIIIGNFSSRSGMALLTEEQKRWIDLQKLIKRQRPSKRPKIKPSTPWRAWCYDRAVSKNGWWSRTMTGLYLFHILALMTQAFSNSPTINEIRDILFLVLTFIYFIDITVRVCGLGLRSFRANGWNLFDVVVVSGSFATTVPIVFGSQGFTVEQLQKLFLVCIAFKLVQKQNSLNRLFKLSISSLPAILKLLLLWIFLFLFFAIVSVEVFGLTRWESAETHNQNYRSVANALLMLVFMSVG